MAKFSKLHEMFDKSDMLHKAIHLPEQIYKTYYESEIAIPDGYKIKKVNHLVFLGMGGSAISADFFKTLFNDQYTVEVVKDYNIPLMDENKFVIAISYSGNTEETLTAFEKSIEKTKNAAIITSGGILREKYSSKYPSIIVESGFPPRAAVGILFFSIIRLFEELQFIEIQKTAVDSLIGNLMQKAGALTKSVEEKYNLAKQTAIEIQGKIPVIYSMSTKLASLAYRWKCQINENAKYPAFSHTFSEMNHNEIEAWEEMDINKQILPIFLSRFDEERVYQNRVSVFKKLLEDNSVQYLEFFTEGKTLMEELFSLLYLGDAISVYLGLLQRVNPTDIKYINYLKNNLV